MLRLVKPCAGCIFWPCACSYIAKLKPGGELEHLREKALHEYPKPQPHRAACACPRCYSLRLAIWDHSERAS